MKDFQYITNSHPGYIEGLYNDFVKDPSSVDPELKKFFAPNNYKIATFPNNQVLDFDGLRSRLLSSSYIPHKDDPRHEQMLARVGEMFDRHNVDGHVTIEYRTELFYGQMH